MKSVLVIGSGAGGAAVARGLQGRFRVTLLEAGGAFKPFSARLSWLEGPRRLGLLRDERMISWLFPAMRIARTAEGMVLVSGRAEGGTTTLAAGNALRQDRDLRNLGLDLDEQFRRLARELPITSDHRRFWTPLSLQAFEACRGLGWEPAPTPKFLRPERCRRCGRCVLGCPSGAKWDTRQWLAELVEAGAELRTGTRVLRVESGPAGVTVRARRGLGHESFTADLCVLAAGGFGTPAILARSGLPVRPRLFVDPVLCLAARAPGAGQQREIPMPFVAQRDNYILSPYFDYLSFFFNRGWRQAGSDIYSLMIKLADDDRGEVGTGRILKPLSRADRANLARGAEECREIFRRIGLAPELCFLGTLNAGHPGGGLPLTEASAQSLHPDELPENVYLADASLLPRALGNPPILTIMALAMKVGEKISAKFG